MARRDDNDSRNGSSVIPIVVAVLGAFGGGLGGNYLWVRAAPDEYETISRPDPFTGTEGRELERRIDNITTLLNGIQRQVDRMPPRELTERLALVEREVLLLHGELAKLQAIHDNTRGDN